MTKKKKDLLSGTCFLVLGLFLGVQAMRLKVWDNRGPEEGLWPLVIAIIITGTSLFVIMKSLAPMRERSEEKHPGDDEQKSNSSSKIFLYSLLLLFYGVLMGPIGFVITTSFFLILTLKYIEKQSWKKTLFIGLTTIVISYLLFDHFMKVPLPKGLLKGWY